MFVALITITVVLILYGVVSRPLDARGVTSAMIFTAAGLIVGTSALNLVNIHVESRVAERFCEFALVFLLFSDSTRIDLAGLRQHLSWPSRLLLIGLPLTILAGFGAGLLVFPGIALASAFVLSTMLCSTDAALGQRVVSDTSVPARVRQALDVESGLNDGLAVPFFGSSDRSVGARVAHPRLHPACCLRFGAASGSRGGRRRTGARCRCVEADGRSRQGDGDRGGGGGR